MRCAMIGAVGDDLFGDELLASLRADGIDVAAVTRRADTSSGVAMITVDDAGQNQIVVVAGFILWRWHRRAKLGLLPA